MAVLTDSEFKQIAEMVQRHGDASPSKFITVGRSSISTRHWTLDMGTCVLRLTIEAGGHVPLGFTLWVQHPQMKRSDYVYRWTRYNDDGYSLVDKRKRI